MQAFAGDSVLASVAVSLLLLCFRRKPNGTKICQRRFVALAKENNQEDSIN
jgi:hypothetical protein